MNELVNERCLSVDLLQLHCALRSGLVVRLGGRDLLQSVLEQSCR